jgi:hypothetical protein
VLATLRGTCETAIDNDLAKRPVMYRQEDYEHLVDGLAKVGWLQ